LGVFKFNLHLEHQNANPPKMEQYQKYDNISITMRDAINHILMERQTVYSGMYDFLGIEVGKSIEHGAAKLSAFEISEDEAFMYNMRHYIRNTHDHLVDAGKYVRLSINGTLYMSDTYMELATNTEFLEYAKGDVLIGGLGMGLVLKNLMPKIGNNTIKSITVVEKSADVIELLKPYFKGLKICFMHGDIFKYRPKKKRYDTIYFDIWEDICGDNLEEMRQLEDTFKPYLNQGGWMKSWSEDECYKQKVINDHEAEFFESFSNGTLNLPEFD
jgi:hypothetical protein